MLERPILTGRGRWIWLGSFLIVGFAAISTGIKDRRDSDARQDRLQNGIKGLRGT
jgi:hypothetical protein